MLGLCTELQVRTRHLVLGISSISPPKLLSLPTFSTTIFSSVDTALVYFDLAEILDSSRCDTPRLPEPQHRGPVGIMAEFDDIIIPVSACHPTI